MSSAPESKPKNLTVVHRIVNMSRYIIALPSIATFLGAIALVLIGTATLLSGVVAWVSNPRELNHALMLIIEGVDIFLIATVLYIISLGLWELFVDDTIDLPHWLEIHTLDDLKTKLLSIVIAVLGVLFLGLVLEKKSGEELAWSGVGIAAVIASLAFFLSGGHGGGKGSAGK